MDELTHKVDDVRPRLKPDWDDEQLGQLLDGVHTKVRRRRLVRVAGRSTLVALLIVGLALAWLHISRIDSPQEASGGGEVAEVDGDHWVTRVLPDGSKVTTQARTSRLRVEEASPEVVSVALESGAARFDVVRRPERAFRVKAGPMTITVIGTEFTVRLDAGQVEVEVYRGRVRVESGAFTKELGVGEAWARALEGDPRPPSETASAEEPEPEVPSGAPTLTARAPVTSAKARDHGQADAGGARPEEQESMDSLLGEADAARRAGQTRQVVTSLRRALKRFPSDPRAPLAAFSLGRVLLDQAGQPREAARSFARVRELAPGGALAEDALAREVEAWALASDPERARQGALRYLKRYPQGRRSRLVRKHGGLE